MIALDTFQALPVEWFHLSPLIVLIAGAVILMVVGAMTPRWPRGAYSGLTAVAAVVAAVLAGFQWASIAKDGPGLLIGQTLAFDAFSQFITITVVIGVALVALISGDELSRAGRDGPEVYVLFLIAAVGAIVMASANELILVFLGLETLSLSLYVLAASDRERSSSQEAGLKYFILGGFASAFFLYGVAMIYGSTGSTNLGAIFGSYDDAIQVGGASPIVLAGVALLLVGMAFKVAAVPFHVWTPDVYQGAPNHVTAFMASVGKAAAFAALVRIVVVTLPFHRDDWRPVIWVLAVLSLVIGSVMAVVQTDVKRMLAFSSISHAGFILVGIEAAGHQAGTAGADDGIAAVASYLAIYAVLTIGSFAVVTLVGRHADGDTSLAAFAGLARRRRGLALGLTIFLLAQAGVPLTSGFVAKWGVIQAAVAEQSYAIAIIAMVSAVIAAYLYLRIMVAAWLEEGSTADQVEEVPRPTGAAVVIAAGFTLVVGIWPSWFLDLAAQVVDFVR